MKTLLLLILLTVVSHQVNAQKITSKKYSLVADIPTEKKPLLACEDSFSNWLNKSNRNMNQLIQPFQPLTALIIPAKNVSRDLSPSIKLVTLNAKNYE